MQNRREVESNVVTYWHLADSRSWYDSTDETTNEMLFYVPVDRYVFLQLMVEVYLTKSIDELGW